MIIREELPNLGYELNENKNVELSLFILSTSFVALAVIFSFIYGPLAFMFTLYALFIGVYIIIHLIINRNIFVYIALPVSLLLSIFLTFGHAPVEEFTACCVPGHTDEKGANFPPILSHQVKALHQFMVLLPTQNLLPLQLLVKSGLLGS